MGREEKTRTRQSSQHLTEALQLLKLQSSVHRAVQKSPFHRRLYEKAGVAPDSIKTFDDLGRLPFMTREDWMQCQAEQPLFGDLITRPRSEAIRYHLTSGTSGRQPLRVLDGRKDWSWIAEMWCYGFWGFGVRPTDTVFFAFSYGSFIGFWGAHYCCEKIRPDRYLEKHGNPNHKRPRAATLDFLKGAASLFLFQPRLWLPQSLKSWRLNPCRAKKP